MLDGYLRNQNTYADFYMSTRHNYDWQNVFSGPSPENLNHFLKFQSIFLKSSSYPYQTDGPNSISTKTLKFLNNDITDTTNIKFN